MAEGTKNKPMEAAASSTPIVSNKAAARVNQTRPVAAPTTLATARATGMATTTTTPAPSDSKSV